MMMIMGCIPVLVRVVGWSRANEASSAINLYVHLCSNLGKVKLGVNHERFKNLYINWSTLFSPKPLGLDTPNWMRHQLGLGLGFMKNLRILKLIFV
jgi:hypothetical protein